MNTDKIKELTASDALNEIERAGRLFKAFERSAEVLSYMVGLEQHERELKDSIARLSVENEKAHAMLNEARSETGKTAQDAKDKAAGIIDKALGEAVGIEQKATADARSLVDQANQSADAACGRRDRAIADAEASEERVLAASNELQEIEAKLAAARAARDKLLAG